MTQWTKTVKPQFVPVANGARAQVFATPTGWVRRHDKGNGRYWDEVLVTIEGAPLASGEPGVSEVLFTSASPRVTFTLNQAANLTNSPVGSMWYQANSTANTGVATVLSVNTGANTVTMSRVSGRFNSANVLQSLTGQANLTISAANNFSTGQVSVLFDEIVLTTGTPTINLTSTNTPNVAATYASGNNSPQLKFNFTVLASTASNVSIEANTLALSGGTIKDVANSSVNANLQFTSAAVANANWGQSGKILNI